MKSGESFEQQIAKIGEQYERRGIMRVSKVDPPVKHLGKKHENRLIYLANPYLDFVGAWSERGGRAIFFEVKDIDRTTLPTGVKTGDGVSVNQMIALMRWRDAGAACFVLWRSGAVVRLVTVETLRLAQTEGRGVRAEECIPVAQGMGFILYDFAAAMRTVFPA